MGEETVGGAVARLMGSRGAQVAPAFDVLDTMRSGDLSSALTLLTERRAARLNARDVVRRSRFHDPSPVPARTLHAIEGMILEADRETEYVELSPVQPFGLNAALADVNQKNVVSSLRSSEVTADAATALFAECLQRNSTRTRLSAHTRVLRAQSFPPGSPLLPHFKIWASVTVGTRAAAPSVAAPDEDTELIHLLDHMARELAVLRSVLSRAGRDGVTVKVSVSNVHFSRSLASMGVINVPHVAVSRPTPIDVPADSHFATSARREHLAQFGLSTGVNVTERFRELVESHHPDLLDCLVLDLHRPYGVGYYEHLCYKIGIGLPDGTRIPIADGGTTDWARRVTGRKDRFVVTSGMGTELLCRHAVDARKL